jgi:hypothetical protein
MKDHMDDLERRRQMYLYSKGFMTPLMVNEEFRQAGFFIKTMEDFIEASTAAEVEKLQAEANALNSDDVDEFWSWNFPVHWEEVIGARIRSAFCTQVCSQVEATLGKICELVRVLERCPLTIKDVKSGAVLEQHRKYLSKVGKFNSPRPTLWDEMSHVFRLRNILIHEEGYVGADRDRNLINFLSSLPNIRIQSGFVELQSGSCPALLDIAKRFSDALFAEYDVLIRRLRAAEANMTASAPAVRG